MSVEPCITRNANGFYVLHQDGRTYTVAYNDERGGTCGRAMRGGRYCTMDHGHRGRCSSVTFCCDDCGKTRRGSPAYKDKDMDQVICFMCVAGSEYGYHSEGPSIYLGMSANYKRHVAAARERLRQQRRISRLPPIHNANRLESSS